MRFVLRTTAQTAQRTTTLPEAILEERFYVMETYPQTLVETYYYCFHALKPQFPHS
jgi:hypothetical protein